MEEALAIDARGEINDPDIPEDQSIQQKRTAQMFEGMLQFSDSEDEEETFNANGTDVFVDTANEGIVGEQKGNLSSLTDFNANQRRLIDEFYAQCTSQTAKTKQKIQTKYSLTRQKPR